MFKQETLTTLGLTYPEGILMYHKYKSTPAYFCICTEYDRIALALYYIQVSLPNALKVLIVPALKEERVCLKNESFLIKLLSKFERSTFCVRKPSDFSSDGMFLTDVPNPLPLMNWRNQR